MLSHLVLVECNIVGTFNYSVSWCVWQGGGRDLLGVMGGSPGVTCRQIQDRQQRLPTGHNDMILGSKVAGGGHP